MKPAEALNAQPGTTYGIVTEKVKPIMANTDTNPVHAAADAIMGGGAVERTANPYRDLQTLDQNAINEAVTWDDVANVDAADIFVSSIYTVLSGDEKERLVGVPFFARAWRFQVDAKTERPYVVIYLVTKGNDLYVITDGSTGILAQFQGLTNTRIEQGHATPLESALCANGLRVSKYDLAGDRPAQPGEKVTGEARTFYVA